MEKIWKKLSEKEIKERVFHALSHNVNFKDANILGIPASYLDEKVFSQDATFLADAPYISTLAQNPNHIGCHTLGKSEAFFKGTQQIERELIEICAVDILKGKPAQQDGYVASGGTEANMQAIWIYRNYFIQKLQAKIDEIAIICSEDSHYSMHKAANILAISIFNVKVDFETRSLSKQAVEQSIEKAQKAGKKYFIVVANMMTTMFGSVDDVALYTDILTKNNLDFKVHVDGAYGGFYYPFVDDDNRLTFENPLISSFTLDAHKMVQAPYGTGIFLVRKNLIQYANTKEASYVDGEDFTLVGSRSGANAVAVWMILSKSGHYGWDEKVFILQKRTEWFCNKLKEKKVGFYRHLKSNIITIKSNFIKPEVAEKFGLVPDNHHDTRWFKVVVMEHVTVEKLEQLVNEI